MQFGIDRLGRKRNLIKRLRAGRVGVLAHAASVDRGMRHLVDLLRALGIEPVRLFAPEHGFGGAAQDMASIADARDPNGGTAIISLYGDSPDDLIPAAEQLADLDVLLIDLCDVGSRYYTYVWSSLLAVRRACSNQRTHCVLLDRANPISGVLANVEGRLQQPGFTSFVGWERVPIRHSLTLAEMVCLHIQQDGYQLGASGALSCVNVRGWSREQYADMWDRPFVLPSPNMPTVDTAVVYPGGCLIEGTNLSEARGHTRPFELVGAPWLDGARLATALQRLQLPGFVARPLQFIPTFHKHGNVPCGGVQIHVTDRQRFRPVACYTALITLAHHHHPQHFRFRTERYEFIDTIPAFDLLTGSAAARQAIVAGEDAAAVAQQVSQFDPCDWTPAFEQALRAARRAEYPD